MSELYIFISELCSLINENLKKAFLFSGGIVFGYSFTRIFSGLDAGLVKFERTNLTKTS